MTPSSGLEPCGLGPAFSEDKNGLFCAHMAEAKLWHKDRGYRRAKIGVPKSATLLQSCKETGVMLRQDLVGKAEGSHEPLLQDVLYATQNDKGPHQEPCKARA